MSTNILNVKLNNNIYPSYEYTTSYSAVYTSSTISNLSADQLENYIISSGNFITPMDYYGNAGNSITDDNVLYTDSSEKDNTKYYWWCESLKNWCFFDFPNVLEDLDGNNDYDSTWNSLSLYTWNGLNGWNSFGNDFFNLYINAAKNTSNYEELIKSLKSKYYYDISEFLNDSVVQTKVDDVLDFTDYRFFGIKLSLDSKYSFFDSESYQSLRNVYSLATKNPFFAYDLSWFNDIYFNGCPSILRCNNGKLILCALFTKWHGPISTKSKDIKKYSVFNKDTNGNNAITFYNKICQKYFGDGTDKTIEDWLHFINLKGFSTSYETPSEITNKNNSSLFSKDIELVNINTVNDQAVIKFKVLRPTVISDSIDGIGIATRW